MNKKQKQPHAISYARFSTPEQSKGDSFRRQSEATRAYCERNNLSLLDDYSDQGISAYKGANADDGALHTIIQRAKEGVYPKGTILIVESLDRISRQEINKALRLFLEILEHGLDIVTLADGERHYRHDKTELVDLIVSLVVLSRAHEESATKSARLAESWKSKRNQARESGKAITSICPHWLKLNGGKFQIIQERAELLREIFKMSLDQNMGTSSIASELNKRRMKPWGSPSKRNKSGLWIKSYVTKILGNPSVYGEFQPHKKINGKRVKSGEAIADYYPTVVEREIFDRNTSKMKSRKQIDAGRPSTVKDYNIFKGLVFCADCGKSLQMTSKVSKGIGYRYLICSGQCGVKASRFDKFENLVLRCLPGIDFVSLESSNVAIQNRNQARQGQIIQKKMDLKALSEHWRASKSDTILGLIQEVESEIEKISSEIEPEQSPVTQTMQERVKLVCQNLENADQSWRVTFRENITRIVDRVDYACADWIAKIQLKNGDFILASYDGDKTLATVIKAG